jgi:hypothetical protein
MSERFRIRMGEAELEVEGSASYIEERLQWFLGYLRENGVRGQPAAPMRLTPQPSAPVPEPVRASSPAEFIRVKRPNGGKEILLTLGYYLEHAEGRASYSQQQVNEAAGRAKQRPIHSQYFTTAVKEGFLRNGTEKGTYALTMTGEDLISSMPRSAPE